MHAGTYVCVSKKKPDFIGKQALDRIRAEGIRRKLCCFTMDDAVQFFGSETIRRRGEIVGLVTSGGFGHTIGKSIAYGYLSVEDAEHTDFEIEAFNHAHAAKRHEGILYDPDRTKVLA